MYVKGENYMPVKVLKKKGLYRICEPSGRIAKTRLGNARDGGGHESARRAHAQAGHINDGVAKARRHGR